MLACYVPPSISDSDAVEFLNFFELSNVLSCDASIIVCGDFNIPSNRKLSKFLDIMIERGFNQYVDVPTRDNSILDLVFVNDDFAISGVNVGPPFSTSDHNSIISTLFFPIGLSAIHFPKI